MLNNRQEVEELKLKGINVAVPATKLAPGLFTVLQNWIPTKKYKIKKKRGPVLLSAAAIGEPVVFPHACGTTPTSSLTMECAHDCPLGQFSQADYIFILNGTEIGGPAIRIQSDSSTTSFDGLAVVYDRVNGKLVLSKWTDEPLSDIGTILDTYVTTLNDGDTIRIESDAADQYKYYVKVNGTPVITYTDSGHTIDVHAPCVGFIEITTITYP